MKDSINNNVPRTNLKLTYTRDQSKSNIHSNIEAFALQNIAIPVRDGLEFIRIEDITHCEGTDGYTKIYRKSGNAILSSYNIGYYHKMLLDQSFYLTHKSHLINLNCIQSYHNEGYVTLNSGKNVPVSRNKRTAFVAFFKKK